MIALVAGQGRLPKVISDALGERLAGVWHLEGFAPDDLLSDGFRIERLGTFIAVLKKAGITQLCFAGAIARPKLDPLVVDFRTLPLVPRMMQALGQGDDGALRIVLSFFEEAGIKILGAHELVPDLLPPHGVLTGTPPKKYEQSLQRARAVHDALAGADVGQGVVVAHAQVLAIETSLGTDFMLKSLQSAALPEDALFYKAPKLDQDRRIDLPAIGPETMESLAVAGVKTAVIEANGVMLLDRAETLQKAQALGLCVIVAPRTEA